MIKDAAWTYEKEIRLRVDLKEKKGVNRVAVSLPKELLEAIVITTGPRFATSQISKGIAKPTKIEKSLFDGKLNYIYSDRCEERK